MQGCDAAISRDEHSLSKSCSSSKHNQDQDKPGQISPQRSDVTRHPDQGIASALMTTSTTRSPCSSCTMTVVVPTMRTPTFHNPSISSPTYCEWEVGNFWISPPLSRGGTPSL